MEIHHHALRSNAADRPAPAYCPSSAVGQLPSTARSPDAPAIQGEYGMFEIIGSPPAQGSPDLFGRTDTTSNSSRGE
jgi:hypothetical protein